MVQTWVRLGQLSIHPQALRLLTVPGAGSLANSIDIVPALDTAGRFGLNLCFLGKVSSFFLFFFCFFRTPTAPGKKS